VKRFWKFITTPTARYSLGALVICGALLGVLGTWSFGVVIHETSTDEFCLVCHAGDIGLEMPGTAHESNSVGVAVGCADCHLPHSFWPKVFAKTKSGIKDVYHTALGTISTLEKFEAHRMHMATVTWKAMNENDSRECRYCHGEARWDVSKQSEKAREYHGPALSKGKTCIDCHKGIAHKLPEGIVPDEQLPGIDPIEQRVARDEASDDDVETAPIEKPIVRGDESGDDVEDESLEQRIFGNDEARQDPEAVGVDPINQVITK
jgi:cytochrome c-type protein NapC